MPLKIRGFCCCWLGACACAGVASIASVKAMTATALMGASFDIEWGSRPLGMERFPCRIRTQKINAELSAAVPITLGNDLADLANKWAAVLRHPTVGCDRVSGSGRHGR
jgi:hypothetical protein